MGAGGEERKKDSRPKIYGEPGQWEGELITKGCRVLCVDDYNWKFTRYNWQRGMNTKQPNPSAWLEPKLMLAATPVHIYSFSLLLFPERDDFEVIWGLGV